MSVGRVVGSSVGRCCVGEGCGVSVGMVRLVGRTVDVGAGMVRVADVV